MRNYLCVNDYAPQDGKLSVYFKKFSGKKSDGFAAIVNGEVFVIDAGGRTDGEMLRFLSELREKWLGNAPDSVEKETAKLEIHIIVSHAHPDHIGALPEIMRDGRFCALSFVAPQRSYLSLDVPGALPGLKEYEDRLVRIAALFDEFGHSVKTIRYLPYGKVHTIQTKTEDVVLTVYPSPLDWSEDRPSDSEGIRFLKQYVSPTYKDNPEAGWVNGILNGNSLWVKIRKGSQAVLITGDQRASDEMLGRMIRHHGEEHFRCDVLKLTHHGEKNYPPYLVKIAKPKVSVFTVDRRRATPETVALCETLGDVRYLGDGNLVLTFDGKDGIGVKEYQ